MSLLEVRGLTVTFPTDEERVAAVRGLDYHVDAGEVVALVGESGAGKSAGAMAVIGLLPEYAEVSGSVRLHGDELLGLPDKQMSRIRGNRIGTVFQDPMSALTPVYPVGDQIAEAISIHQRELGDRAARARAVELLELVGIAQPEQRARAFPHELSGGERQRVVIAIAIANDPDLLICDEPTTALDVTVQAQILKLLDDLKREERMSMLFITHDLGIVRRIADRVCVMTKGKIVEAGPTEQIFSDPQHDYTKHLLAAEPKGRPILLKGDANTVMRGENVKVWFPIKKGLMRRTVDNVKAVDGIDVTVRAGQTLGIVGESGSGKTTLGLALTRLISSEGRISFDGKDINAFSFKDMMPLRREIQIVFQDPFGSLSPRMSVAEIVGEGLAVHEPGLSRDQRDARVVAALGEVGLDPETRFRYPHEFSGGQRQRIAIARAMVLKPTFVMLDEPTSALDMSVQAQVVDLLRDLQRKHDLAYLFISHDLKVVRALANDVMVMRNGVVVEQGRSEDIFDNPKTDYTKALMAAAFDIEVAPAGIVNE